MTPVFYGLAGHRVFRPAPRFLLLHPTSGFLSLSEPLFLGASIRRYGRLSALFFFPRKPSSFFR
jgi:hypothetical protein